jgi:GxxExxY protein
MDENRISNLVIGQSLYVHRALGPGLGESAYEECLAYRLVCAGLRIEKQKAIPLVFEGVRLDCGFRCDLIIEKKLILEVKSVDGLNNIHMAQILTYLKLTDLRLGLLINFNVVQLKDGIRRVANNLRDF